MDSPKLFDFTLSPTQLSLTENLRDARLFLEGPAGSGKTTAAIARLLGLIEAGVPGDAILLLVPQRTLALPYTRVIRHPAFPAGRLMEVFTLGSLTRRMVQLFWPLVSASAGFAYPDQLPTFLNLETAQYYMAYLVRPLLDEGLFASVHIDRNRLYSQIIDNINKSALVGFPLDQISQRLKAAWIGEPGQLRVYEDVQTCANLFRMFCLSHNLVDFSIQVEIFFTYLWRLPLSREFLRRCFQHLIFDNLEEDVPVTHDLIQEWLPEFDTALLVYDSQGGVRSFLGADPQSAYTLKNQCSDQRVFEGAWATSPAVSALENGLGGILRPKIVHSGGSHPLTGFPKPAAAVEIEFESPEKNGSQALVDFRSSIEFNFHRFFPQMLDWVAEEIERLVLTEGLPAGEIVVLAPYLSDALRFSLSNRLQSRGIPSRSHRPSRSLRDEPATACLLTLAALAFPDWGFSPSKYDVVKALMQAIDGLDLVRGQLLADIVYRVRSGSPELSSFDQIKTDVRERITYLLGGRYDRLRVWIENARQQPDELDFFFSRLFGEILSQPGFGFHRNYDAGRVTANLIDSVRNFRLAVGPVLEVEGIPLGKEYVQVIQDGVIAAQNIRGWQVETADAVLLAPAYSFLMSNRPVEVQFWLDIGSRGWAERVHQPLTHPYVLSRHWSSGRAWSDADEVQAQEQALSRLVFGLLRRCRQKIYLGLSDLSEQGYEQRGPLLRVFNRLLTTP